MKTIQDVVERQLCAGCGACVYAEPNRFEMQDTGEFCRKPVVKSAAKSETGAAMKICPGYQLEHESVDKLSSEIDATYFPGWGPVITVYEGYASDPKVRFKGSSGGAATALSLFAIEDGAEGVLHTGASTKTPYLNKTRYSCNSSEIIENAGSRYSPSSPCEDLSDITERDGKTAFVGKPCDVAAIHNLKNVDREIDEKIHVTVGFFCAGTPSTVGLKNLLEKQGVTNLSKLRKLKFRGEGWPGLWKATHEKSDGEVSSSELTYAESWGYLQKFRQWRCYVCPDHTAEFADISVGDPWYRKPQADEAGQSLIVVRTAKGQAFLERAVKAGVVVIEKEDKALLPASQPNLIKARGMLWGRLLALRILGGAVPEYRNFTMFRYWVSELSFREKISSITGTAKRVFRKRLNKRITINSNE